MQGAFGYELDLSKMSDEDKESARWQIAFYNENYRLFQKGRYYRLTSPFENQDFTAWSYVSEDQKKAVLCVVYTDLHGNSAPHRIKLKGLCPDRIYRMGENTYSGAALMNGGVVLQKPQCNYDSCMLLLESK